MKFYCFSCDGEIPQKQVEKAEKDGKYSGLCSWCKAINRSLNLGGITNGQ